MNIFDIAIIEFINQFSQHSLIVDQMFWILAGTKLLKGSIFVIIIWWAWFKTGEDHSHNRKRIILTLLSCVSAIILARVLVETLPFRVRPLHQEGLNFLLPYGGKETILDDASSFPSDHATLFFALTVGLCYVSKNIGVFSLFYALLFISFPRIYLGLHYPTDISAGAIIGTTIAIIVNLVFLRVNGCNQLKTGRI